MGKIYIKEETLGQRIKAQRIRLGMTQEELAEATFIPKPTISNYENDRIDIKSSVIRELSVLLETTPNHLLGFETAEDSFISEATDILRNINDEKVRKMLLLQLNALR